MPAVYVRFCPVCFFTVSRLFRHGRRFDRTRCVGAVPGGCADETEAARSFGVSEKGKRGRIGRNRCRGKGASGENRAAARARRRVFPLRLSPRKFAICLRLAENCSDGGAFFIRFRVRCGRPNAHGTSGRKARCSSRRTAGSAGARSELSVSGRRRNDVFPRLGGVRIAPSLRRLAGNDGLRARSLVYGSGPPPPLLPAPPASERTSGRRERSRLRSIAGPPRRKRRRFRGLFLSARGLCILPPIRSGGTPVRKGISPSFAEGCPACPVM